MHQLHRVLHSKLAEGVLQHKEVVLAPVMKQFGRHLEVDQLIRPNIDGGHVKNGPPIPEVQLEETQEDFSITSTPAILHAM